MIICPAKLQEKVRETADHFTWYNSITDCSARSRSGKISELPFMTEDILRRFYYHQETSSDSTLAVYRTSGTSSGIRKSILYSEEDDRRYIDIKTRLFGDLLRGSSIRRALADMGTGHAAGTALTIFTKLGLECGSIISYELPIERHIEKLEEFRPDLFYTMPSILDHIVYAADDPTRYGIRKIILVGEIASPQWQRKIAGLFRIRPEDIIDTYGSIEIGTIAYYSHDHSRYFFTDGIYAEGIPAEGLNEGLEPLGDDESILVLTSFARTMFPAIRFVTYDVMRDFRTVTVDGVPRQSFQCLVKRVGHELKHGEKISLYDIEEVIYQFVDEASVRVKLENNALIVFMKSKSLDKARIPVIQRAIEQKIPEIGMMINNRILDPIEVVVVGPEETLERGTVKNKKLYY